MGIIFQGVIQINGTCKEIQFYAKIFPSTRIWNTNKSIEKHIKTPRGISRFRQFTKWGYTNLQRHRCQEAEENIQCCLEGKTNTRRLAKCTYNTVWKNRGDNRDSEKYRGISLLSDTGNIYANILGQRLRPIIETQLSKTQFRNRRRMEWTDSRFCNSSWGKK